jgi:hypothetical protein
LISLIITVLFKLSFYNKNLVEIWTSKKFSALHPQTANSDADGFTHRHLSLSTSIYYQYINMYKITCLCIDRDSSAVRRLFSTCCSRGTSESSTYGKQRICPPTLGQHITTFRGYLILFSIRNPYINRFTNHFSIHS